MFIQNVTFSMCQIDSTRRVMKYYSAHMIATQYNKKIPTRGLIGKNWKVSVVVKKGVDTSNLI